MSSTSGAQSPDTTASAARWFAEEVHAHDSQLKSYLRCKYPGMRDVDDVVQESYLRTWRALAVRPIRSGKAFVFSVARRLAIDRLRRDRVASVALHGSAVDLAVNVGSAEPGSATPDQPHDEQRVELLGRAIAVLPARCREVILLHKIDGLTQREVATRLGISEKTVENHVANGVKRCEVFLRKHGH